MAKKKSEEVPSLSRKEHVILQLLTGTRKEMFGAEMIRESDGRLKTGTVYVTLQRMEEKGFVESYLEERPEGARGMPRRLYRPTGLGKRVLMAYEAMNIVFSEATT